jgi:serine/threonine-protein kinase
MDPLVGTAIGGRYDVLELLGQGGMGAVYRVRDRELDEVVALKVIRSDLAGTLGIVDRFRTEVKLARRVTHGNVARTYELGHAGDLLFCTMELVFGEPLSHVLRRRGALTIDEAVAIACAVADGLAAAHAAGVIHRDIKPDNIIVGGRVVITDFGVAALAIDEGEVAGTPAYMAPEQTRGEPPTPAADIYALGVVLYEMVTGARAFTGDDASIYAAKHRVSHLAVDRPEVPHGLSEVIARATEREPSRRIATAAELCKGLSGWRPDEPALADRQTTGGHGLTTVVVSVPKGDDAKLYLAEAVHTELLSRLAHTPRMRVTVADASDAALRIELRADDALAMTATGPNGLAYAMRLPLAVEHVRTAAESIAAAIVALLVPPERPYQATELLLRSIHVASTRFRRFGVAVDGLEQAAVLAGDDPEVAALLASGLLQRAFASAADTHEILARARNLVRLALVRGPQRYSAHLAAGQLELHTGEATTAAGHFRVAIRCAPHAAAAHEQLGRMLLEAAQLDAGFARLEDASALAPQLRSAHWPIARALALEGRWQELEHILAEMGSDGGSVARVRIAVWLGDRETVRGLRGEFASQAPQIAMYRDLFDVVCDNRWGELGEAMFERAATDPAASLRTRAFRYQLLAESAATGGDDARVLAAVTEATRYGLFDLHWLDRCPLFARTREHPGWAVARAPVAARADAILDALYGDHVVAAPEATRVDRPSPLDAPTRTR